MQMKQCPNGHFYDQSKSAACPYCSSATPNVNYAGGNNEIGKTMPVQDNQQVNAGKTMPLQESPSQDDGRTMVFVEKEMGIDPVVGWLVCVEGAEKGRDFRIHTENNYIGRAEKMDICIHGDDSISRENQAVLVFDPRTNIFYIASGSGKTIIRVNNMPVLGTQVLNAYDRVEFGVTKFVFIPYCKEGYSWTEEKE